ncbi:hypothetical protein ACVWBI_23985, partial [Escherichia coli]
WKGWAILLRQKQKKLIMLPSETMIWQPEFTDKTLSRKPGAVQDALTHAGVLMDDEQFDEINIVRGQPVSGGRLGVKIYPIMH